MNVTFLLYLLAATALTYLIRVLPLTLLRRPIRSTFVRSFLYYVPYVTLSVMVFPALLYQTGSLAAGIAAMVVGVVLAWLFNNLFLTAAGTCIVAFLLSFWL